MNNIAKERQALGLTQEQLAKLFGWGQGGMATKAHDIFTIPLCRQCHTELHNDPVKFEQNHVPQPVMIIKVLDRAYGLGVLA